MKHKKIWLSIFISTVFLIMAACGSAETPATPTLTTTPLPPTATPTETATPLPPTATPSPTVTATPTLGIGSTQVSPKDGMVMLYVPAGEFLMGSTKADIDKVMAQCSNCKREMFVDEKPQHTVRLDAFWIDLTEVTNGMFEKFVEAMQYETDAEKKGRSFVVNPTGNWKETSGADWQHPWGPSSDLTGRENHPVVHVSWNDSVAYCQWAGGRLPSEAEWEKAARGTDGRTYPWGEQAIAGNLLNFADKNTNFDWSDTTIDDGYGDTAPVGNYPQGASVYGVLDMAGNVWEWVADWYSENYYASSPSENPQGPDSGEYRIVRGGSWLFNEWDSRSSDRAGSGPSDRSNGNGFRCVR